ncbi:hypothetical protein SAMN06295888_1325 [Desulfonatronum zhilinae]|nr:hypothetical protein SAMN06295888_1325 [Desulfonatronum zhilinae]
MSENKSKKASRLIAVYDFSTQPFSIGDIILFIYGAIVEKCNINAQKLDFCFIADPKRQPLGQEFVNLMKNGNHLHNIFYLLPIFQFAPNVNNIFIKTSFDEFIDDVSDTNCYIWPSIKDIFQRKYKIYDILSSIHIFTQKGRSVPQLFIPQALSVWCDDFFSSNIYPDIPVTVNIRNNPTIQLERNSCIDAWLSFFDYCCDRYPVKFIVICSRSEIDERLRERKNVVVAKDMHTLIENDLALTLSSAFHLGSNSGPATMPYFTNKPCSIFNCANIIPYLEKYGGAYIRTSEHSVRYSWCNSLQKILFKKENCDILIFEFENIWYSKKISEWLSNNHKYKYFNVKNSSLEWLRNSVFKKPSTEYSNFSISKELNTFGSIDHNMQRTKSYDIKSADIQSGISMMVRNAESAMHEGKWDEAAAHWEKAFTMLGRKAPPGLYVVLARCQHLLGNHSRVVQVLRQGMQHYPADEDLRVAYAEMGCNAETN